MAVETFGKTYFVGEYPPALACEYVDKDGVLDTSISGATLTALVLVDDGTDTERTLTCTNDDDGNFTIDFETNTGNDSDFPVAGVMRVDVKVVPSSGGLWYMPRFSIPVISR